MLMLIQFPLTQLIRSLLDHITQKSDENPALEGNEPHVIKLQPVNLLTKVYRSNQKNSINILNVLSLSLSLSRTCTLILGNA